MIHRKPHQCEAEGAKLARKAGRKGKKKNIARGKELPQANQALPHLGKAKNNPGKPNPAETQKQRVLLLFLKALGNLSAALQKLDNIFPNISH